MQREAFLNSTHLPRDRSFKRNSSTVINALPASFINQGGLTLNTGEETRSRHHTRQTFSQTIISPIYSSHSPFLKIIYSSLRGSPLSLLKWFLILNSKDISLSSSFLPGHFTCVVHEVYMLINLFVFSLVNLSFMTGVSAKNSEV